MENDGVDLAVLSWAPFSPPHSWPFVVLLVLDCWFQKVNKFWPDREVQILELLNHLTSSSDEVYWSLRYSLTELLTLKSCSHETKI